MPTDPELLLLAAAVDGDLTPAQAKAVRRLLAADPAAARLFAELKADAARLKALPRRQAPAGTARRIMARVQTLPVTPARKPARRVAWVPFAVAASVLVAVAAGSFYFFAPPQPHADDLARHLPVPPPDDPAAKEARGVAVAKAVPPGSAPDGVAVAKVGPDAEVIPAPRPDVVVQVPPPAPTEPKDVFTVGEWIASKPLTFADMKLPTLVAGTEFDKQDVAAILEREFARDLPYRVDVFSKSPAVALDQLQAAAKAAGVNVFVDALTAERMKLPTGFTFAVYLDNLTPAELAAVFGRLAKQANAHPNPDTVLGLAHLIPAGPTEQKEVKDLIGVEFATAKAAKPAVGPAEPKPISADTLAKVTAAVRKGEKAGVVVTFLPPNFRTGAAKSAEVKQFLEKRGERKPGTVPVLVVIRS
jgi:anti-sigma factor RsiW